MPSYFSIGEGDKNKTGKKEVVRDERNALCEPVRSCGRLFAKKLFCDKLNEQRSNKRVLIIKKKKEEEESE